MQSLYPIEIFARCLLRYRYVCRTAQFRNIQIQTPETIDKLRHLKSYIYFVIYPTKHKFCNLLLVVISVAFPPYLLFLARYFVNRVYASTYSNEVIMGMRLDVETRKSSFR